jgi:hypothetical protein
MHKQDIYKVILFLIPLITFLGLIEWNLSRIPNSYTLKDHLSRTPADIQILVLGSSHSYFDINPSVWPIAGINLANTSQSLWYDSQIAENYIPRFKNLKLVIMPISYFSLWYDLSINPDEYFRQFYYFRFMRLLPSRLQTLFDIRNFSLIALYQPSTVWTLAINHFSADFINNINETGSYRAGYTRFADINDIAGKDRVAFHEKLMSDDWFNQNVSYLKNIISLCQKRNIAIMLLTLPVYPTYANFMNPQKINSLNRIINDLTDNKTVYSKNYITDDRFTIDDFFENDHLNTRGADKLSGLIYTELMQPILAK